MPKNMKFQSYCWSVGTTGYRTKDFNLNIENQLLLMSRFRSDAKWDSLPWGDRNLQTAYYHYLKECGALTGTGSRQDKDARLKTSGLVDIGLMDKDRRLTQAGQALLDIAKKKDFAPDNDLELDKDSYIYLKQLLKTGIQVREFFVRPFLVFLSLLSRTGYLTCDEFTYILPLCLHPGIVDKAVRSILEAKEDPAANEGWTDRFLLDHLMDMDNYQIALTYFQMVKADVKVIQEIGMNRDGPAHDAVYWDLYQALEKLTLQKQDGAAPKLYAAVKKLSNPKVRGMWRNYLFLKSNEKAVNKDLRKALADNPLLRAEDELTLKKLFFEQMHLFKAKANLSDYFDLNRRYFKATGAVLFDDQEVRLDLLPGCYFSMAVKQVEEAAFEPCARLGGDISMEEILPGLRVTAKQLYDKLSEAVGVKVATAKEARDVLKRERYRRFDALVDKKFPKETLALLLEKFEERDDDGIRKLVTNNADIPTIFEYILAVSWYWISGRQGDVLDFMNLSLEPDMLPKTHAGGGEADIVWKYPASPSYLEHTLLLEATLAEGSNQRRMEMEPVSRHVGDYLLANPDKEAYGILVTTSLHRNVISDFRNRSTYIYYGADEDTYVKGMKLIPLDTEWIRKALDKGWTYPELYKWFETAWRDGGLLPVEWYDAYFRKGLPASCGDAACST